MAQQTLPLQLGGAQSSSEGDEDRDLDELQGDQRPDGDRCELLPQVTPDLGDPAVAEVRLEDHRRSLDRVGQLVDLEQLGELALVGVLGRREVADLGLGDLDVVGEHLGLVGVEDVLVADELLLVGVDDRAVLQPHLDSDEVVAEDCDLHSVVEVCLRGAIARDQAIVCVGLDHAFGDVEGGIASLGDGLLGANAPAGECREDADQGECSDGSDAESDDQLLDRRRGAVEVLLQLGVSFEHRGLQRRRRARTRFIRDVCAHARILPRPGPIGNAPMVLRPAWLVPEPSGSANLCSLRVSQCHPRTKEARTWRYRSDRG